MSLATALLNSLDEIPAQYVSVSHDLEEHIVINDSRQAIVPDALKTIAVTGDKDIETVTFDCVRHWDGYDLSTFSIYLNYVLPDRKSGTYIPKYISTSKNGEYFHFDWTIERNITNKSGKIAFAVTAIKTKNNEDGEPVVDKQWSSIPNNDMSIALGLDISDVPTEEEDETLIAQLSKLVEEIQRTALIANIVNTLGTSEEDVISQKAVTDNLADISDSSNFDTHMKEKLIRGGYAEGEYYETTIRVSTDGTIYLPFDAYVEIESGYRVVFLEYNSPTPSKENCTNNATAVWSERSAAFPKNVYCTVAIAKTDNSDITIEDAKNAVKFRNSVYTDKMLTFGRTDSDTLDSFLKSLFTPMGIDGDGNLVIPESPIEDSRVCLSLALRLQHKVTVNVPSGYKAAVHTFSDSEIEQSNHLAGTNWIENGDVSLPVNTYCALTFARIDDGKVKVDEIRNAVKFYNYSDIDNALAIGQSNSDVLDELLKSMFIQCGIGPDGNLISIATRVCLRVALKFPNKVFIDVPSGYQVTIHKYSDSEINNGNHIIGFNWNTDSVVVIDSNDYVAFAVSKVDGSNITIEEAQRVFKFRVPLDEKMNDYYYTGEPINFKKHSFKVKEILSAPYTIHQDGHQGIQGFDIHNGVIAQCVSDNVICLIDIETGKKINEYVCHSGHGCSASFSKTYRGSGDEFPLLYVAAGGVPDRNYEPIVYVYRIRRDGYDTEARIKYSESVAGYWASACFDFEKQKMYLMGYTENSYSDNTSGNNLLKLTTWDMSQITSNDDGTISYALESTFTFPYMYCLQSLAFHDGKIFALISVGGIENTEIRVIDPASGNVVSNFSNFPHAVSVGEAEGLSFANVDDSSQMVMCVKGDEKFTYYGFTFT